VEKIKGIISKELVLGSVDKSAAEWKEEYSRNNRK